MGLLLVLSGLVVSALGTWRSYAAAREAIGPLVHDGEPTRSALEAARPIHARTRVRLFARRLALAVGWLLIALYGLFLLSVGLVSR
jgi:hypothetical protein